MVKNPNSRSNHFPVEIDIYGYLLYSQTQNHNQTWNIKIATRNILAEEYSIKIATWNILIGEYNIKIVTWNILIGEYNILVTEWSILIADWNILIWL